MKTEIDLVARQYTAWCYPNPVPDLATHVREGIYDASDPSLLRRRLWPRRTEREDLDILIAGCGTYQAAFYAFTNPHCRVTGIDLSETSLQHHMYLKERHGLSNLSLRQMDLLDVESLGQAFDCISCHRFLVCHPERATGDYRPDFASEAALTYKPAIACRGHIDAAGALHRQGRRAQLTPTEAAWLRRADGNTPLVELLAGSKPGKGVAMRFFSDMWERGHLVFDLG